MKKREISTQDALDRRILLLPPTRSPRRDGTHRIVCFAASVLPAPDSPEMITL